MNRRDMLSAAGTAAALFVAPAMADEHEHHHDHGAMAMPTAKVIPAALDCIRTGNACIAHCFALFASGDTSVAGCARTVDQMLSTCATLVKLASVNSARLPEAARLALALCQDCEKECRKHADKHAECKACAESCAACAEECKKLAA